MRVTCADVYVLAYLDRYMPELVSYDILDENEDGIFEPGEHLIIRYIVVQNIGKHSHATTYSCELKRQVLCHR